MIDQDGKSRPHGYFRDAKKVARAYDKAAKALSDEHACLNFPDTPHLGP